MDKVIRIYQLKDDNKEILFEPLSFVERKGIQLKKEMYDIVYEYKIMDEINDMNIFLEKIFERFNLKIPKDYKGHSLSISDIVGVKIDGEEQAYYVDRIGFKQVKFE